MDKTIEVRVTARDIKTGINDDPEHSSIAKAVCRLVKKSAFIGDFIDFVSFKIASDEFKHVDLNNFMRKVGRELHNGKTVKPFSFKIKVPANILKSRQ